MVGYTGEWLGEKMVMKDGTFCECWGKSAPLGRTELALCTENLRSVFTV